MAANCIDPADSARLLELFDGIRIVPHWLLWLLAGVGILLIVIILFLPRLASPRGITSFRAFVGKSRPHLFRSLFLFLQAAIVYLAVVILFASLYHLRFQSDPNSFQVTTDGVLKTRLLQVQSQHQLIQNLSRAKEFLRNTGLSVTDPKTRQSWHTRVQDLQVVFPKHYRAYLYSLAAVSVFQQNEAMRRDEKERLNRILGVPKATIEEVEQAERRVPDFLRRSQRALPYLPFLGGALTDDFAVIDRLIPRYEDVVGRSLSGASRIAEDQVTTALRELFRQSNTELSSLSDRGMTVDPVGAGEAVKLRELVCAVMQYLETHDVHWYGEFLGISSLSLLTETPFIDPGVKPVSWSSKLLLYFKYILDLCIITVLTVMIRRSRARADNERASK